MSDELTGSAVTEERMRGLNPYIKMKVRLMEWLVAREQRRARKILRAMPQLWGEITDYRSKSKVINAAVSDYLLLYQEVRRLKPKHILELGTGISTVALTRALLDNEAEGAEPGFVTSMEESADWADMAREVLPAHLAERCEIIHSPKIDGTYKMFRGVRYTEIPDRPYDFVFSDGPERHSPVNNDKLFDLDLILVALRSERPIRAVVDNHYLTFYVLQKVFGTRLARYDVRKRLMFVGPVNKHDVRHLKKENFLNDLRFFGRTELKLRMALDEEWE